MSKLTAVLLFLLPLIPKAQQVLKVSPQAQLVYSKYDNAYYVFDDSSNYHCFHLKKQVWEKKKVHYQLEQGMPYTDFRQRFYPIPVGKGHCLFVLDGCGLVYEFKNDTIKRIDNSYDQKNQFQSAMYEYKRRVYMFGGYGLFSVKNTHTYFDIQAKEWFEVYRTSKAAPAARSCPYFIQTNKELFVLGGIFKQMQHSHVNTDFWRFNYKQKSWELLGELNPDLVRRIVFRGFVQNKDYRIFHYNDKLTIIDPANNKYLSYTSSRYFTTFRILPDKEIKNVLLATHPTHNSKEIFLRVKPLGSFLYGNPTEYYLYKPVSFFKQVPLETYLWLSVLLNVGLFFLLFYSHRITKAAWYKPKHPVLYRKDFSEVEWEALLLIKKNDELELSALNYLFDEPGLSYETLKKRRESFVRALRIKLALLTRRDVEQLLQESKHPLDKRMKIIRWGNDLEINLQQ